MLKKIPHCTDKVAYFQTHKSNEIILKYIDRKSLEIAVKEQGHGCLQDLPLGRAFGRNLQPHK